MLWRNRLFEDRIMQRNHDLELQKKLLQKLQTQMRNKAQNYFHDQMNTSPF